MWSQKPKNQKEFLFHEASGGIVDQVETLAGGLADSTVKCVPGSQPKVLLSKPSHLEKSGFKSVNRVRFQVSVLLPRPIWLDHAPPLAPAWTQKLSWCQKFPFGGHQVRRVDLLLTATAAALVAVPWGLVATAL